MSHPADEHQIEYHIYILVFWFAASRFWCIVNI